MIVEKTELDGVLLIKLNPFEDHRGEYVETYNMNRYRENGITVDFVEDDISVSSRHVLRGIHGDDRTWKLISCLHGKFLLAVVNCDMTSHDFGKSRTFTLSEKNRFQVLIPPNFGNGHLVLSEKAIFHYKQSSYYQGMQNQFTYRWDEPKFNIWWPVKEPILSNRDAHARYIQDHFSK